jgi:hypothetical protein
MALSMAWNNYIMMFKTGGFTALRSQGLLRRQLLRSIAVSGSTFKQTKVRTEKEGVFVTNTQEGNRFIPIKVHRYY